MKHTIPILILFLLTSCDITKSLQKSKSERDETESIETSRTRKGDSVTFKPVLNVRYKDTTIYVVNREGTTLRTIYDKQGQVSQIDCNSSAVKELIKENRRIMESNLSKDKQKTEEVNTDWILYVVIGLVVIVLFGMAGILWFLNSKFGKLIP